MEPENKIYLIYRNYNEPERKKEEQKVLFAWSKSKALVKGFLKQRDNKKYIVLKSDENTFMSNYGEFGDADRTMLNYINLKSVKDQQEYCFFTTLDELQTAEIEIQRYMSDLSTIDDIEGIDKVFIEIMNLKPYYLEALIYLGYRPSQLDQLFPSASEYDEFNGCSKAETEIEDAYSGDFSISPMEYEDYRIKKIPGLCTLDETHNKILYSLEAFIKVLKDDL